MVSKGQGFVGLVVVVLVWFFLPLVVVVEVDVVFLWYSSLVVACWMLEFLLGVSSSSSFQCGVVFQ